MSKKIRLDEIQIAQVEALAAYLPIDKIAGYFGFTESTFHEIKKRQPEVLIAYNKGVAKACSFVGTTLMGFIREKENTPSKLNAITFYLRTKGGWTEKQEMSLIAKDVTPNRQPLTIINHFTDDHDEIRSKNG
jgi:hypothetical protein